MFKRTPTDAEVARCKARMIEPGASYLVTRSCYDGQFLFHPTAHFVELTTRWGEVYKVDAAKLIKNTQGFLLGVAAHRYGVAIHSYNFLSNHYHQDIQDRLGLMPDFYRWQNGLLARATNRYRKRGTGVSVFAPGSYNAIQDTCRESSLHSVGYASVQSVRHTLTHRPEQWAGLHVNAKNLFEERIFYRDELFFRGERDHFKHFFEAPREQQIAYLEELAKAEREATIKRVAEHIAKLPAGTCFGVDPFADARTSLLTVEEKGYVPVVLPIEELRSHGPLVVAPHAKGNRIVLPSKEDYQSSGPLAPPEGSVAIGVPTEAMKDINKALYGELNSRPLPPAVVLKCEKHAQWADVSDEDYLKQLDVQCEELIEKYERARTHKVYGMKTLAASFSWKTKTPRRRRNQRSVSKHRDGSERLIDDESIRPTFRARTVARYRELARRRMTFKRRYVERRIDFETGDRELEMPWGTYLLVVRFHAKCAAPPY